MAGEGVERSRERMRETGPLCSHGYSRYVVMVTIMLGLFMVMVRMSRVVMVMCR